jgi:hypothetical protein
VSSSVEPLDWPRRVDPLIERPVLVYDGDCRFCRFSARLAARADRHGRLAYRPERDLPRVRLLEPSGTTLEGGHAVAAVLGLLVAPSLRRLGPVLEPPYALVSRLRGYLGRLVPDGPGPRQEP